MGPISIYFVRHGHVHNPQGIVYARLPRFGLSEQGMLQARRAGSVLSSRHAPFAAIFSSPLLRARQTARAICASFDLVEDAPAGTPDGKLPFHISKMLIETYTPFQGSPLAMMEARNWEIYNHIPPGYDQPHTLLERALRFVALARRRFPTQEIIAVTHGDLIAFLTLWVKRLPVTSENRQAIPDLGFDDSYPAPGSISILTYQTDSEDEKPSYSYPNPMKM
jgi:broad specificity phosphatase PhoE